jgi:hypothetical protein
MQMLNRILQALDSVAASAGMPSPRLDAERLCAGALRKSGRAGFRDNSFLGPLRLLLQCCDNEANLNIAGRYAARWDALRCLSNLLRFEAEEESNDGITAQRIEKPIFITGFPRSGTTLLHSLLALDSMARVPRCRELMFPYPAPGRDTRRSRVDRQLRLFHALAPRMRALHPLSADAPQECTEITAQVFQSLRYEMTHRVPSYQSWLDRNGHLPAYRFHKRFLQHLQHRQRARRWILKSPDHVHALNAIEAVYPDCGIVFVHRDPLRVAASAMKLTEVVRRPFTRHLDKVEIGRQVLGRVTEAAETVAAISKTARSRRVFHLHHAQFAADPVATLESLYRHFDMELTQETRGRVVAHLANTHHTHNGYSFEEFGLNPAELCDRFQFYMDRFEVRREFDTWKNSARARAPVAA